MVFVLVVLLAALIVATLRGGRLSRLGTLPLRWSWLVPVALALQVGGALKGGAAYPLGLVVSVGLAGAFLALNRRVRGTAMVALGLLANALVVGLNGAMPVSLDATGRAGVPTHDLATGQDPRHELAGPGTHLRPLGDVIPVLLPGHPEVVSPGDVLIAAGLAELVVVGMLPARSRALAAAGRGAPGGCGTLVVAVTRRNTMAKKGRKRRSRKKSGANHGKRPNA